MLLTRSSLCVGEPVSIGGGVAVLYTVTRRSAGLHETKRRCTRCMHHGRESLGMCQSGESFWRHFGLIYESLDNCCANSGITYPSRTAQDGLLWRIPLQGATIACGHAIRDPRLHSFEAIIQGNRKLVKRGFCESSASAARQR